MTKKHLIALSSALFAGMGCLLLLGIETGAAQSWKSGSALRDTLEGKIKFASKGELVDDLASLSQKSGVAILLDRAIDPSQKEAIPGDLMPLGKLLDQVAEQQNGTAIPIGSSIYIVPRTKGAKLDTLRAIQKNQLSKLSTTLRKSLLQNRELSWTYLSNPKDILNAIVNSVGFKLVNHELIEHDLWRAQQLPNLPVWEQLALLFNMMDLAFVIDEAKKTITAIKLLDDQSILVPYRKNYLARIKEFLASENVTSAKLAEQRGTVFVQAPYSVHNQLATLLIRKKSWKNKIVSGSKEVFDLKTNAMRGAILKTIANNRGVELRYNAAVANQLQQTVSINVKQASADDLIKSTLSGTTLRYRLTDTHLEITQ